MHTRFAPLVALLILAGPLAGAQPGTEPDPFAYLQPTIQFSDAEKRRLDERLVVIKILPASGHELAALAAGSLNVGPDAFVASVRSVVDLKRGQYVPEI